MSKKDRFLCELRKTLKGYIKDRGFCCAAPGPELCKKMSCFGTPDEIAKLIKAGYAHAMRVIYAEGVAVDRGRPIASEVVPIVQFAHSKDGCPMYCDGDCLLADYLVPSMGAISLLTEGVMDDLLKEAILPGIVMEWINPANRVDIDFCLEAMENQSKIGSNHLS